MRLFVDRDATSTGPATNLWMQAKTAAFDLNTICFVIEFSVARVQCEPVSALTEHVAKRIRMRLSEDLHVANRAYACIRRVGSFLSGAMLGHALAMREPRIGGSRPL